MILAGSMVVPSAAAVTISVGSVLTLEQENPYVTLGVAGVLLGAIVVPTTRWLMQRIDRQQDSQEKLIGTLTAAVEQSREIHRSLIERADRTNQLLTDLHQSLRKNG